MKFKNELFLWVLTFWWWLLLVVLTEVEQEDILAVFQYFDTDRDGFLTPSQTASALQQLGVNVSRYDLDGFGAAGASVGYLENKLEYLMDERTWVAHAKAIFTMLDKHRRGFLLKQDIEDYFEEEGDEVESHILTDVLEEVVEYEESDKILLDDFMRFCRKTRHIYFQGDKEAPEDFDSISVVRTRKM